MTAARVGEVLLEAQATLAGAASSPAGSARLDASVLLAHVLGLPRTALIAHPERPLDRAGRTRYRGLVERRAAGEPLAWLTGRREFWSLDFEVDRSTLVPRPETERLVEAMLEAVRKLGGGGPVRAADLGTGCGAVAISFAREAPRAEVLATDIDWRVLAVARRNVRRLAPGRVALRQGSWCEPLESESYSIVASNPPYLRADDPHLDHDGVRREPRRALIGGRDGLGALRAIARGARRCLTREGRLLLEHGAAQGSAVRGLLATAGFEGVRTLADAGGRERVTEGTKP